MTIPYNPLDNLPGAAVNPRHWPSAQTHISPAPVAPEFKPKKAGKNSAHVVFILDSSSSMMSCYDSTIKGFNEFLKGHRESDVKTFVSLYTFNGSETKCVHDHVDVLKVEELTKSSWRPSGSTNLLDSIGEVMHRVNGRLRTDTKKNRDSVQIVILTDGEENSSRSYDNAEIKAMVESAEGKEWTFMFLGANIDAFDVGGLMGFSRANTLSYSTAKMDGTFNAATRMSTDLRNAKAAGMSNDMAYAASTFSEEERKDAE